MMPIYEPPISKPRLRRDWVYIEVPPPNVPQEVKDIIEGLWEALGLEGVAAWHLIQSGYPIHFRVESGPLTREARRRVSARWGEWWSGRSSPHRHRWRIISLMGLLEEGPSPAIVEVRHQARED